MASGIGLLSSDFIALRSQQHTTASLGRLVISLKSLTQRRNLEKKILSLGSFNEPLGLQAKLYK
jgi:hypothetical protein